MGVFIVCVLFDYLVVSHAIVSELIYCVFVCVCVRLLGRRNAQILINNYTLATNINNR
jgi:hypothetical protein